MPHPQGPITLLSVKLLLNLLQLRGYTLGQSCPFMTRVAPLCLSVEAGQQCSLPQQDCVSLQGMKTFHL